MEGVARHGGEGQGLRLQGIVFCALALLVSAGGLAARFGTWAPARPSERTELEVTAVLIVLLGVPHGALDSMFAERSYRVRSAFGWLAFVFAYLMPVALVAAVWKLAPLFFLAGFLVISAAHFSGDPRPGTPAFVRLFYGGAIIVLPCLLHQDEVGRLFTFLAGKEAAAPVVYGLGLLSRPWLVGVAASAILALRRDWLTALEIAAAGLLAVLAPPLEAFTVFFCVMHSARHILRSVTYARAEMGRSPVRLLPAALGPMLGFLVLFAAASRWLENVPVEARLMQLVFVALAGLTVPHMMLVEPVRLAGWGGEGRRA